ncbi:hypothetical protein HYV10_02930 [Candidatus Dependentiae bacterium]|nr:hypothetical protein [Candidatus Dependentiae bacterium]
MKIEKKLIILLSCIAIIYNQQTSSSFSVITNETQPKDTEISLTFQDKDKEITLHGCYKKNDPYKFCLTTDSIQKLKEESSQKALKKIQRLLTEKSKEGCEKVDEFIRTMKDLIRQLYADSALSKNPEDDLKRDFPNLYEQLQKNRLSLNFTDLEEFRSYIYTSIINFLNAEDGKNRALQLSENNVMNEISKFLDDLDQKKPQHTLSSNNSNQTDSNGSNLSQGDVFIQRTRLISSSNFVSSSLYPNNSSVAILDPTGQEKNDKIKENEANELLHCIYETLFHVAKSDYAKKDKKAAGKIVAIAINLIRPDLQIPTEKLLTESETTLEILAMTAYTKGYSQRSDF